jgi:hypothetical protein
VAFFVAKSCVNLSRQLALMALFILVSSLFDMVACEVKHAKTK